MAEITSWKNISQPAVIRAFSEGYDYLSNFYQVPITLDGTIWPTTEHYFQAMKTIDPAQRELIRTAPRANIAKAMGGRAGYKLPNGSWFKIELRPDWEAIKVAVMTKAVGAKFYQYPVLSRRLVETYPFELIEGNHWHDNTWGDCSCSRCISTPGLNLLGLILMKIRIKYMFVHNLSDKDKLLHDDNF